MNQVLTAPRRLYQTMAQNSRVILPAVALFVVLMGANLWRSYSADRPLLGPNGVPLSPEIEERFGVRFMGLHVLARQGLVDLRYRVVDAGKAKNFGHYTETSPLLIADGGNVEVTIMGMHNHRVEAGRVYYILYRNTGGVIRTGETVTIQIGDLHLREFPIQ
jgi:hypothetical protein